MRNVSPITSLDSPVLSNRLIDYFGFSVYRMPGEPYMSSKDIREASW